MVLFMQCCWGCCILSRKGFFDAVLIVNSVKKKSRWSYADAGNILVGKHNGNNFGALCFHNPLTCMFVPPSDPLPNHPKPCRPCVSVLLSCVVSVKCPGNQQREWCLKPISSSPWQKWMLTTSIKNRHRLLEVGALSLLHCIAWRAQFLLFDSVFGSMWGSFCQKWHHSAHKKWSLSWGIRIKGNF